MSTHQYVYTSPDGAQVLLLIWPGHDPHIATRTHEGGSWGPPLALTRHDRDDSDARTGAPLAPSVVDEVAS